MIQLEQDLPYELNVNDRIFLLVSLYSVNIVLDHSVKSISPPKLGSSSAPEAATSSSDPTRNDKKRPRPDAALDGLDSGNLAYNITPDVDSDDDGVVILAKKPKLVEAPNTKIELPSNTAGGWSGGLLQYLKDPTKHADVMITYTDEIVVIKDKWPKAKLHLLVMPRVALNNLSYLRREHIPLLQAMERLGKTLGDQWLAKDGSSAVAKVGQWPSAYTKRVAIGFHAIPSMTQVHMHVISDDFDSASLKTKKHWNSFLPPFFQAPAVLLQQLQDHNAVQFDKATYEAYLEAPLKCHRCGSHLPNVPALKGHISSCSAGL